MIPYVLLGVTVYLVLLTVVKSFWITSSHTTLCFDCLYIAQVEQLISDSSCVSLYANEYYCFGQGADFMNVPVLGIWPDDRVSIRECEQPVAWHLNAISDKSNLGFGQTYAYDTPQAQTSVYILDTWLDTEHPEFQGRASVGATFASGRNDHATHVAGLIGSTSYGVNKHARLISVQVLDDKGSGLWSTIIKGLAWISTRNASLINISIGGPKNTAINQVLRIMERHGWKIVVAAGNENQDACNTSPAGSPDVVAVAAYNVLKQQSDFSNWGECIDIQSPGQDILSTLPDNQAGYLSGTSMASPIVAGVWSLHPDWQINKLKSAALNNQLQSVSHGTINLIVYAPHSAVCLLQNRLRVE